MAKFKLRDQVRKFGREEVFTVEEIREIPGTETLYWIELGGDFATRDWARESELKLADAPQTGQH